MARRTRATRSNEDEDAYSSDEDASESDADAVDDVEDDNAEDTPVERILTIRLPWLPLNDQTVAPQDVGRASCFENSCHLLTALARR